MGSRDNEAVEGKKNTEDEKEKRSAADENKITDALSNLKAKQVQEYKKISAYWHSLVPNDLEFETARRNFLKQKTGLVEQIRTICDAFPTKSTLPREKPAPQDSRIKYPGPQDSKSYHRYTNDQIYSVLTAVRLNLENHRALSSFEVLNMVYKELQNSHEKAKGARQRLYDIKRSTSERQLAENTARVYLANVNAAGKHECTDGIFLYSARYARCVLIAPYNRAHPETITYAAKAPWKFYTSAEISSSDMIRVFKPLETIGYDTASEAYVDGMMKLTHELVGSFISYKNDEGPNKQIIIREVRMLLKGVSSALTAWYHTLDCLGQPGYNGAQINVARLLFQRAGDVPGEAGKGTISSIFVAGTEPGHWSGAMETLLRRLFTGLETQIKAHADEILKLRNYADILAQSFGVEEKLDHLEKSFKVLGETVQVWIKSVRQDVQGLLDVLALAAALSNTESGNVVVCMSQYHASSIAAELKRSSDFRHEWTVHWLPITPLNEQALQKYEEWVKNNPQSYNVNRPTDSDTDGAVRSEDRKKDTKSPNLKGRKNSKRGGKTSNRRGGKHEKPSSARGNRSHRRSEDSSEADEESSSARGNRSHRRSEDSSEADEESSSPRGNRSDRRSKKKSENSSEADYVRDQGRGGETSSASREL